MPQLTQQPTTLIKLKRQATLHSPSNIRRSFPTAKLSGPNPYSQPILRKSFSLEMNWWKNQLISTSQNWWFLSINPHSCPTSFCSKASHCCRFVDSEALRNNIPYLDAPHCTSTAFGDNGKFREVGLLLYMLYFPTASHPSCSKGFNEWDADYYGV